jgi:hypothetical protein
MSCLLANGRGEVCKDTVGGLRNVYFINYGINKANVTYDATNTDMIETVSGIASLYKFELKGTNTFEQVVTSSRENGTTFVEQTLSIQLKKQDAATTKNVKLLAYGRPHVVVENNAGQYFLAGFERGLDLTTGNISNGTALGDFNGYSLTFVGQEKIPANFLDCSTEAGLATLFATATVDATIVAS